MDYNALGKRIKEERKKKHLTQGQLAELVNVSINFISQIELAKSRMSVETFYNVAQALDVSTDSLLGNMTGQEGSGGIDGEMLTLMKRMSPAQRHFAVEHAKGLLELTE